MSNAFFEIYVEGVGDAVDVIEVADDLCGVVNGAVIEAVRTQCFQISFGHVGGAMC